MLKPIRNILPKGAAWALIVPALFLMLSFSGCIKAVPEEELALIESVDGKIGYEPSGEPDIGQDEIPGDLPSSEEEALIEEVPETVEEAREESFKGDEDNILFSFTVTGDSRPADDYLPMPGTFITLLELIKDEKSSFNISVGDIINGQTADEVLVKRAFSDYLDAVEGVYPVNFVSPGNHDIINDTTRKFFREMILDKAINDSAAADINVYNPSNQDGLNSYYYYYEINGIYYVILNAFEPGYWGAVKDGQLSWLEGVLESLKDKAVFVAIHTPPYSFINPDTITDGSKQVGFSSRDNLEYVRGLFKEYSVDAVFSGHEHVYNKEFHDGTHYIITALAGEYPYFPEEDGGFYHYIRVDIKASSWLYNVIGIDGDLRYQEEISFN